MYSGCGTFYDPATFQGNIAEGCHLSVAVDPTTGELRTRGTGDITVAADGRQYVITDGRRSLEYLDTNLNT